MIPVINAFFILCTSLRKELSVIGLPCMSAAQSDQQKFVSSTQGILTPRGASSSSRGQSPDAAPIAGGTVSRVLM